MIMSFYSLGIYPVKWDRGLGCLCASEVKERKLGSPKSFWNQACLMISVYRHESIATKPALSILSQSIDRCVFSSQHNPPSNPDHWSLVLMLNPNSRLKTRITSRDYPIKQGKLSAMQLSKCLVCT